MTQQSGLTLAYLGDAYYELQIRTHLIQKGYTKVNDLHKMAIAFTSATGQAKTIYKLLDDFLSEEEIAVYKRGRNATSTHKPKNADLEQYRQATGFEALIGFLLLEEKIERLNQIILKSISIIEELPE